MALVYRTYECPACLHRWEMMQDRKEAPPKFCPDCGQKFAKTLAAVPGTHSIGGSTKAKSVDETYRMLETAGDARARLAERDGVPSAQARNLKITNMHDNMREGDVATVRSTTTLEREAQQHFGLKPGFWGGSGSFGRISSPIQTPQGTYSGPGHYGLAAAQTNHRANVAAVVASGKRMPNK